MTQLSLLTEHKGLSDKLELQYSEGKWFPWGATYNLKDEEFISNCTNEKRSKETKRLEAAVVSNERNRMSLFRQETLLRGMKKAGKQSCRSHKTRMGSSKTCKCPEGVAAGCGDLHKWLKLSGDPFFGKH